MLHPSLLTGSRSGSSSRAWRSAVRATGFLLALLTSLAIAGTVPVDPNAPIRLAQDGQRSGDKAEVRLHGSLARLQAAHAQRRADLPKASGVPSELIENGRVLVEVRTRSGARTAVDLSALGGEVRHRLGDSAIEAWVPIAQLDELTALAGVVRIWPARMPEFLEGSVTSQGVAAGQAGPWLAAGLDGDGVTIAIIDGFDNDSSEIADLQGSGDWPQADQLTTFAIHVGSFGGNNQPHGNAVLELAYDIAPGAAFIAYDVVTLGDWIEAIHDAETRGAGIVSASLGAPFDGIGDGSALDGSVAEAVEAAEAAGVIYINAAGNSRQKHWGGLYDASSGDAGLHAWNGNDQQVNFHGPANGQASCLADGAPLRGELFWADWTDVDHDYDLLLLEYDGSVWNEIASSTFEQSGAPGQMPQEFINETAASSYIDTCEGNGGVYGWAISKLNAPNDLNLQFFSQIGLDQRVFTRSLGFPADSPAAISVAALNHSNSSHESYSSEGPILAPGGNLPTGSEHPKPDTASFARVDTVSYGAGSFAGTSASAPHVAGMAALLKQRHPGMTQNELVDRLQQISVTGINDLGTTGHDFQHGYGRLRFQLEDALAITQQPTNTEVDAPIGPVQLKLRDNEGLVVLSGPTSELNATIGNDPSGGDAVLSGTATRPVVDGLTSFDDLSIDKSGTGYTLSLGSAGPGPVESDSFDLSAGAPSRLAFDVQPSETKLNQSVTPAMTVLVLDSNGNLVTDDNSTEIQLAIVSGPSGGTLSGGGPVTVAGGEALFDAVSIDEVGEGYQLEATDTGGALDSDTSVSFNIIPGDPVSLSFIVQPSEGITGNPIEPAVEVEVLDADGNRVTWDGSTDIELVLSGGSGGSLSGGGPLTVTNGLAVFDSLVVDLPGSGYRLEAVDPAGRVSSDNSDLFDIIDDDIFSDRFEDAGP